MTSVADILANPGVNNVANALANVVSWNNVAQGYSNGQNTISSTNQAIQGQYAPLIAAGATGNAALSQIAQNGTTQADVNAYYQPGVEYSTQQALNGITTGAAARGSGGTISAPALNDISSFITGQAQQNYSAAAQLAQNSTAQRLTAAGNLSQVGVSALDNASKLNSEASQQIAVEQANVGNANAGGIVGGMYGLNGSFQPGTAYRGTGTALAAGALAGSSIAGLISSLGSSGSSATPGDGTGITGGSADTNISGSNFSASSFTPTGIGAAIGNAINGTTGADTAGWSKVAGILGGFLGGPVGAVLASAIGQYASTPNSTQAAANIGLGVNSDGTIQSNGDYSGYTTGSDTNSTDSSSSSSSDSSSSSESSSSSSSS